MRRKIWKRGDTSRRDGERGFDTVESMAFDECFSGAKVRKNLARGPTR